MNKKLVTQMQLLPVRTGSVFYITLGKMTLTTKKLKARVVHITSNPNEKYLLVKDKTLDEVFDLPEGTKGELIYHGNQLNTIKNERWIMANWEFTLYEKETPNVS